MALDQWWLMPQKTCQTIFRIRDCQNSSRFFCCPIFGKFLFIVFNHPLQLHWKMCVALKRFEYASYVYHKRHVQNKAQSEQMPNECTMKVECKLCVCMYFMAIYYALWCGGGGCEPEGMSERTPEDGFWAWDNKLLIWIPYKTSIPSDNASFYSILYSFILTYCEHWMQNQSNKSSHSRRFLISSQCFLLFLSSLSFCRSVCELFQISQMAIQITLPMTNFATVTNVYVPLLLTRFRYLIEFHSVLFLFLSFCCCCCRSIFSISRSLFCHSLHLIKLNEEKLESICYGR